MSMIVVAASGYALVGVLFVVLSVMLVTSWRGQRIGRFLIVACLASAFWGLAHAWNLSAAGANAGLVIIADVLRAVAWIAFLTFLLGRLGVGRTVRLGALMICAAVVLASGAIWLNVQRSGGLHDPGPVLFIGGLVFALVGLMLIEQLYRNSPPESHWSLKPLVLGLGGVFAFDLFLYSQAVLLGGIDATSWYARGLTNIFFVPAIAVAARRNPDWQLPIFVSRQVVFYSTTLTAVGVYLLLMALGGYLLMRFGGSWGSLTRVVFFAGAALVLLTLLFSASLRARLKVFLNKHFFHNKYDYRVEWMRLIATLAEAEGSSARSVFVKAVAQIVGSPSGVLWIESSADAKFVLDARLDYDHDVPDITRDDPAVAFMRKDSWLIDLAELRRSPEIYADFESPQWLTSLPNAWLLIPLMFSGKMIGLIMLTESPGRPRLNYEDRDLLKTVANHSAVHIAQTLAARLLTEAQQFETYHKLTAFLMHDMNNLIAQQSLIVSNAEKHKRNPEFVDDSITTIAGSVERMKRAMERLKRGPKNSEHRVTELRFLASTATDRCMSRKPAPVLRLNGTNASVSVNFEEFVSVLTHLIKNAQDATPTDGEVLVNVSSDSTTARIEIQDSGSGMAPEFIRERLFRPFDSTKGSRGMGIGVYQARELARSLGGDLSYKSEEGKGTLCTLSLPVTQ